MNDEQHNLGASQSQQTPTASSAENPNQAEPVPHEVPVEEVLRVAGVDVRKAAEAVCRTFQEEAAERVKRLRETTVGDLIDGTLNLVKKYPGPGVVIAVLIGFMLGRSLSK